MAKEYDKFKAEWDLIKKEVTKAMEDIKANEHHIGQTSGIIQEGAKEIGKRVQELKDQGQAGDELKDFLADPEVKLMSKSINDFLASIEKELKRVDTLHKGPWAKTKSRYFALKTELAAEIKSRKKQVSTKMGLGNKSLPNMEQLLKDIQKFDTAIFTTFAVFEPETIAQHRKETGFKIDDEIKKAKGVRLTEYQTMMMEQALNTRRLKTNFGKAKTLYGSITKALKAAEDAKRNKQPKELSAARDDAKKLLKELLEIVEPYEKAPQDQWIRARMQESKDRSTIESGIKAFGELKTKGTEAVAKIKAVKL